MSYFRRHPSTAETRFWLSSCDHPQPLDPEDLTHHHDGWFTVSLLSAWADRHLGRHIPACYHPMPGRPQPANSAGWIQVLDSLSARYRASAFLAHSGAEDGTVRGHFYALRRWNGQWLLLDSRTLGAVPITPTGQLPELLSMSVYILHLCPRPHGCGRARPAHAFLPIPTQLGSSCAPVHPRTAVAANPPSTRPPRSTGILADRPHTRPAQAAGMKIFILVLERQQAAVSVHCCSAARPRMRWPWGSAGSQHRS